MDRYVVWFSCGAASTVAAYLTLKYHPNAELVYTDTGSEHEDNKRYIADVEKWLGKKVKVLKSEKYADIWDVFENTKYLVGVNGARCTTELKKKLRQDHYSDPDIVHVWGYTVDEKERADRYNNNNPDIQSRFPLIERGISKADCLDIISQAGIELPKMYQLGYVNNNCIGCVKGQAGYWNKIRRDFPEVFDRMAKVERQLDVAINKRYDGDERIRVFLDELDPQSGNYVTEPKPSCGLFCGQYLEDDK